MHSDQTSRDLERRKYVRLRIRPDLAISPQRFEGRSYYVIKDPVSLRYYRFKEQEYFLLGLMDGKHTLDEAQKAFEDRFRPDRLTLEDLEHFGQQLLTAGLVQNESPGRGWRSSSIAARNGGSESCCRIPRTSSTSRSRSSIPTAS